MISSGIILFAIGFLCDDVFHVSHKKTWDKFFIFSVFLNCCLVIGSSIGIYDITFKEECVIDLQFNQSMFGDKKDGRTWWNFNKTYSEFNPKCRCPNGTETETNEDPWYCQAEACLMGLGKDM